MNGLSTKNAFNGMAKFSARELNKHKYKSQNLSKRYRAASRFASNTTDRTAKKTRAFTTQVEPKSNKKFIMLFVSNNMKAAPMKKKGHPCKLITPAGATRQTIKNVNSRMRAKIPV